MSKLLIFVAIVFAVWFFVFRKKSIKKKEDSHINDMVECSKCGMYVSSKEAIMANGKWYCSVECLKDK